MSEAPNRGLLVGQATHSLEREGREGGRWNGEYEFCPRHENMAKGLRERP
jgi:hypothetical protein